MSFEDIQIGDFVIINSNRKEYARRVKSMTKTLFTVAGTRFRKKDGRTFGGVAYSTISVRKCTEEEYRKIRMSERRNKLHKCIIDILQVHCPSLEDCEAVYSILNKYI